MPYETFRVTDRGKKHYRFLQRGGGFDRNRWNNRPIYDSIMYIEINPVLCYMNRRTNDDGWPT
jgi:hypothetical protein